MNVLVTAAIAARILDISTQALIGLRKRKVLIPVKSKPFRYSLSSIEKRRREIKPKCGRKMHEIEIG